MSSLHTFLLKELQFLLMYDHLPTKENVQPQLRNMDFHANNTKYVYFIFHFSSKFQLQNYPENTVIFT
ncbi:hypothetical protein PFUGPA_05998 [Plasmodium falciparum Palo Alto/Uganda]|uniref:Uncharacterized protein n=1 Tax=Plasmodium falciparum (isolate Palo Alto / Uganda) TaxID=57270 RepID=W4IPQ2_PLAFP|nr:hypothetical protein PFUGPA_05998 [Plasmodium falciparum Palo Alto/Uganda]